MQITRLPVTIKMPSFQKNVTIQEIVIHKSASTITPALCLTFSGTRILHRQLKRIYTDIMFAFMTYNTSYFHYRQIFSPFLKSPTRLPTKSPTLIVGNQLSIRR